MNDNVMRVTRPMQIRLLFTGVSTLQPYPVTPATLPRSLDGRRSFPPVLMVDICKRAANHWTARNDASVRSIPVIDDQTIRTVHLIEHCCLSQWRLISTQDSAHTSIEAFWCRRELGSDESTQTCSIIDRVWYCTLGFKHRVTAQSTSQQWHVPQPSTGRRSWRQLH